MKLWPWRRRRIALESVHILRLNPGDILVLTIPEALSAPTFADVHSRLQAEFPDHKTIVLCRGWELSVIADSGQEAQP